MWTRSMKGAAMVATVALATFGVVRMSEAGTDDAQLVSEARQTVAVYKKADPGIEAFFRRSVGYVVFPGIGKGGSASAARTARASSSRAACRSERSR